MTPKEIDAWLKENNKDRAWLADKLAVSYHTARGWFSGGRPIPKLKLKRIEELKAQLEQNQKLYTSEAPEQLRVVGSTFTSEEIELMRKAANGEPLESFLRRCILEQTRRINEEE